MIGARARLQARRDDSGFTLVELLVVLVLVGVLGAMVSLTLIRSLQVQRRTTNRTVSDTSVTNTVDFMTKNIRAASPLVTRSATSLSVEAYHSNKRYRYTWSYDSTTGVLSQTTARYATATASTPSYSSTRSVVTGVTNSTTTPVFAYYHRDGSVVASTEGNSAVARVDLVIRVTPAEAQPVTVQTSIFLRNYVQN